MPDVFVSKENNSLKNTLQEKTVKKEVRNMPFLSSFCQNPHGIQFVNQEHDEEIILFLRRHFIKNISWSILSVLLLILPVILFLPIKPFNVLLALIPFRFLLIFFIFYYLIVVGYIFTNFITWFYNVGIITSKQIIDIDFTDIMYREVAKVRIQDVIDVEYNQGGFLHSIFDFGTVYIQTEGIKPNFEFNNIPYPDKTTDLIIDLKGSPND